VEESLSLRAAVTVISQTYLGGEDALFTDMRAELESQISNRDRGSIRATSTLR
jgi:hypothetical protein